MAYEVQIEGVPVQMSTMVWRGGFVYGFVDINMENVMNVL